MINPKQKFEERIKLLLGAETETFFEFYAKQLQNFIRCNTLKISPEELRKKLSRWHIEQPYEQKEIMLVKSELKPGELGKAREHLLGYYYIQDLSSMMPAIALDANENETVLDICAAPGSKTTQIAAQMKNSGLLVANDSNLDRLRILITNLGRCGVTNIIATREDAVIFCKKFSFFKFDKILLDMSCSGEGTRGVEVLKTWNPKMIEKFSRQQKIIAAHALQILKPQGTMVYSTCTMAPEENEQVTQFLLDNFNIKIENINLPLKTRQGIEEWQGKHFSEEIKNCCRIYPQDNNTEGFFVAKIKKLSEEEK